MIQGSVVWNEANCFLHRLYEEIYGDFIPPSLTINGVVHHPRSVADIVRLHVDDTPVLGDWKTLYHVYVFNIANFSGRKSVVPEKLRRKISRAILFNVSDLASALARMGGREDMHDGVSAIANRLHARHAFKSGANPNSRPWQECVKGFADGLGWLADLERRYPAPADWVASQIEQERLGAIDAEAAWAMAQVIASRRGAEKLTYMGPALSLNFLKDIGLQSFVKPDTHILGLTGSIIGTKEVERAFRELIGWANAANIWPRSLDRALWLIGSGDFHYLSKADGHHRRASGDTSARRNDFANIVRARHGLAPLPPVAPKAKGRKKGACGQGGHSPAHLALA